MKIKKSKVDHSGNTPEDGERQWGILKKPAEELPGELSLYWRTPNPDGPGTLIKKPPTCLRDRSPLQASIR